jgi:hypothetical protein
MKLAWGAAAVLCVVLLVFLWIVAQRRKEEKLDARYGREPASLGTSGLPAGRVALPFGKPTLVEGFTLEAGPGTLSVTDRHGILCARFHGLAAGQKRRWLDLEVSVLAARSDAFEADVGSRAGSPCLGAGTYYLLRPGLTVEFPDGRAASILSSESDGLLRVTVAKDFESTTLPLRPGDAREAFGLKVALVKDVDRLGLRLDP